MCGKERSYGTTGSPETTKPPFLEEQSVTTNGSEDLQERNNLDLDSNGIELVEMQSRKEEEKQPTKGILSHKNFLVGQH